MEILNKLTIKHLVMNKKRTIVTIVGIILSTALMVGIGLIFSSARELMIEEAKQERGEHHVIIKNIEEDNIGVIKKNTAIKKTQVTQLEGYAKINEEINDYYKVLGGDKELLKTLDIIKGRLPKNNDEIVIPKHVIDTYDLKYEIGDTITLDLGQRYKGEEVFDEPYHQDNEEYLKINKTKTYKIVGIISKDFREGSEVGFNSFTTINPDNTDNVNVIIEYKKPSQAFKLTEKLASSLSIEEESFYQQVVYNEALLTMYGVSKYANFIQGITSIMLILLSLVAVACIIVIYNSFAISVMERKKQFGLFSSIGTTKKQIKQTVLFEAFIVSIIGIPLGILSAYIGISVVLIILNNLVQESLFGGMELSLTTYPLFLLIPIIFMVITVFISAIIPAKRASKISPIEAIRLNDDIKIVGKKVKTPKYITKIFGIEGEIALKSMKRNKKKYRITVVSLFISIVLFISFSSYLGNSTKAISDFTDKPDFDIYIDYDTITPYGIIKTLRNNKDVTDSVLYTNHRFMNIKGNMNKQLTSSYLDFFEGKVSKDTTSAHLLILDNKDFTKYIQKMGKKIEKPVLYNLYTITDYEANNSRKTTTLIKYKDTMQEELIVTTRTNEEIGTIKDYYLSETELLSLSTLRKENADIILVNEKMAEEMFNDNLAVTVKTLLLKTSSNESIDREIKKSIDNQYIRKENYINIKHEMKMISNMTMAVEILVYGFITLVTLIGVTSVFNTINTCMQLRRKEFAMLRSIGLTPKGFNKILFLESLFFGLKSIIYAIPVSLVVIAILNNAMASFYESNIGLIPWTNIIVAILGVFIIVGISTLYSTSKIKKENILDSIREENI